ncbi:hypothetical protein ACFWCB_10185 [Streptomyces sp. NPDC060048]|uniref:hypothetical protein n=1 Tax=unclassified Streptomyces TaxID=2593676 RepID=UPI0036C483CC
MTPSLEWLGHGPAAVSAVHALVVLVRLCRRSLLNRKDTRSQTAGERTEEELSLSGFVVVRVDVAAEARVDVRVTVAAAPGAAAVAGGERGPW